MQVKLLGLAPNVEIGGANGPEKYSAGPSLALAVFQFEGTWDEAKGQAAIRAMESAGNGQSGGNVSVASAVGTVTALAPHLSSPGLQAAAQAADELLQAYKTPQGVNTQAIFSTAIHLATNAHLLTGSQADIANAIAGAVASFFGPKK